MAFQTNTAPASNNNNNSRDDSWKAQGFLNFYLPAKDGKKKKLGAIPLKASKASEKALADWLNEDPARAVQILAKLVIEYQSAAPVDTSGFDLGQ